MIPIILLPAGIEQIYIKIIDMKTEEDTALELELQELYLASKHWLSDIDFISDELRFFKDVIRKYFVQGQGVRIGTKLDGYAMMLDQLERESLKITARVTDYLKFMEPYVSDPAKKIGLSLIEKHTTLENDMSSLFDAAKLLKKSIFSLAEEVMWKKISNQAEQDV